MGRREKLMIFLDTHVVVWLYDNLLNKLSNDAIQQIEDNGILITQMVRLELQYLFEIGRIKVTAETIIKDLNRSIGLKVSQMKVEQVFDQAIDYHWTRDVFDRLITAEAEAMGFALVTKDKKILANYEKAIW
jgi:PIN domain nuclease of toxin-antitoxin system